MNEISYSSANKAISCHYPAEKVPSAPIASELKPTEKMEPRTAAEQEETTKELCEQLIEEAAEARAIWEAGLVEKAKAEAANIPQPPKPGELESSEQKFMESMLEGVKNSWKQEERGRKVMEIKTEQGTLRMVIIKRLNYSPAKDLSGLARAGGIADVYSLIGGVSADMNRIKCDKTVNEREIKVALAQMEGIIARAQSKIRQLREEMGLEAIKRRAASRRDTKKSENIGLELNHKRTTRKAREYAQIRERMLPSPGTIYTSRLRRACGQTDENEEEFENMSGLEAQAVEAVAADIAATVAAVPVMPTVQVAPSKVETEITYEDPCEIVASEPYIPETAISTDTIAPVASEVSAPVALDVLA